MLNVIYLNKYYIAIAKVVVRVNFFENKMRIDDAFSREKDWFFIQSSNWRTCQFLKPKREVKKLHFEYFNVLKKVFSTHGLHGLDRGH